MADDLQQRLDAYLNDQLQQRVNAAIAAQTEATRAQRQAGLSDVGKVAANANTGLTKGIADIGGLPHEALGLLERFGRFVTGAPEDAGSHLSGLLPSSEDIQRDQFGPGSQLEYRPETGLGAVGQATVRGGAGGAPFGGVPAVLSAVGGAAGEAAGQATAGTPVEGPARLAAAIIAAGAAGLPGSIRGTPAALINQATRGLTPAQWSAAQRLQNMANALGVRITGAEALGRDAPSLLQYQRMAEGSPASSGAMGEFMAQRPAQVQAAGNAANNAVGPAVTDTQGATTAAQQAAEGAIQLAEKQRTAAVNPSYQVAAGDQVPLADTRATIAALDTEIASNPGNAVKTQLQALRRDLIARAAVPGVPATKTLVPGSRAGTPIYRYNAGTASLPEVPKDTIDQLDSVRKYWSQKIDLPPIAAEATAKEVTARIRPILTQLRDSMTRASPDFAYGKALYKQITDSIVTPLQESATGNLAKTGNLASQIAIVADPAIARPDTIRAVIANLSKTNPEAARDLIRLHLENSFDRANKALQAGPNQMGGAKFNVAVAGTPQQAANLEAAIRALPNGDTVWNGYQKMLDVFEATGRRLPAGSRTDENQAARAALQGGGVAGLVAGRGNMGLRLAEWYRDFRLNKNTAQFARILTDPDSVALMRRLAQTAPDTARAQTLVAALLQVNQQRQSTGRAGVASRLPPPAASPYSQPFSGGTVFQPGAP